MKNIHDKVYPLRIFRAKHWELFPGARAFKSDVKGPSGKQGKNSPYWGTVAVEGDETFKRAFFIVTAAGITVYLLKDGEKIAGVDEKGRTKHPYFALTAGEMSRKELYDLALTLSDPLTLDSLRNLSFQPRNGAK